MVIEVNSHGIKHVRVPGGTMLKLLMSCSEEKLKRPSTEGYTYERETTLSKKLNKITP
jgi:hypothetical protein